VGLDEEEGCLSRSRSDTAGSDTSRPASRARSARSSGGKSFAAELRQLTSTMTGARHFFFEKNIYHPLFYFVFPPPQKLALFLCSTAVALSLKPLVWCTRVSSSFFLSFYPARV
jgi:hypothetical protein